MDPPGTDGGWTAAATYLPPAADLMINTEDPAAYGHVSADLFLGPITGTTNALDADLVIDQTAYNDAAGQLEAGYGEALLAQPDPTGSGVARIAVGDIDTSCDEGLYCLPFLTSAGLLA